MENNNNISYEYYKRDIELYRTVFEHKIEELNTLINLLKNNGRIDEATRIEARIKSYKSFYRNLEMGKNVDDCFGIKIVASQEDLIKIRDAAEFVFEIRNRKDHSQNKNTGYNAVHFTVLPKKDDKVQESVMFELQFCTFDHDKENSEGKLAHDIYKIPGHEGMNYNEAKKAVWKEYDRITRLDPREMEQELPDYYILEEGQLRKLSRMETVRKLFPTIFLQSKKEDAKVKYRM